MIEFRNDDVVEVRLDKMENEVLIILGRDESGAVDLGYGYYNEDAEELENFFYDFIADIKGETKADIIDLCDTLVKWLSGFEEGQF